MCRSCWEEYGSPTVDNERVWDAASSIADVYGQPGGGVGGGLHIVVDDFNIEDEHIQWCIDNSLRNDAEIRCATLLMDLSLDERASALALYERFWESR